MCHGDGRRTSDGIERIGLPQVELSRSSRLLESPGTALVDARNTWRLKRRDARAWLLDRVAVKQLRLRHIDEAAPGGQAPDKSITVTRGPDTTIPVWEGETQGNVRPSQGSVRASPGVHRSRFSGINDFRYPGTSDPHRDTVALVASEERNCPVRPVNLDKGEEEEARR